MGKGMTAKRKRKKNNLPASKYDLEVAQKKIDRQYATIKNQAASDATVVVGALYCKVLIDTFGFTTDQLNLLVAESDRISDRISDPEDPYTWNSLIEDLSERGVEIQR